MAQSVSLTPVELIFSHQQYGGGRLGYVGFLASGRTVYVTRYHQDPISEGQDRRILYETTGINDRWIQDRDVRYFSLEREVGVPVEDLPMIERESRNHHPARYYAQVQFTGEAPQVVYVLGRTEDALVYSLAARVDEKERYGVGPVDSNVPWFSSLKNNAPHPAQGCARPFEQVQSLVLYDARVGPRLVFSNEPVNQVQVQESRRTKEL